MKIFEKGAAALFSRVWNRFEFDSPPLRHTARRRGFRNVATALTHLRGRGRSKPDQIFASIAALEVRTPTADRAAMDDKELLTAKEVEELVRIDVKTIYSYVQRGLIPYVRIQSNLRFLRSEVLAWVAEHRSGTKPRGR